MQFMLDAGLEFKKKKSNQLNVSNNTQHPRASYGNEGPRLDCCNIF